MPSSIVFEREYGVRVTETPNGETLTAISQPDWPATRAALERLGRNVTGFIVTPELITTAEVPLPALAANRPLIESRIEEAKEVSRRMPDAVLLLGSAALRQTDGTIYNAVLFLQDGNEVGRTSKVSPLGKAERQFLPALSPPEVRKPVPHLMNIICSDLIAPPPIDPNVNTLVVSGCWGVPAGYKGVPASPDAQHLKYIGTLTDGLFQVNPALQTIVMTDRGPFATPAARPFNFIANRQS